MPSSGTPDTYAHVEWYFNQFTADYGDGKGTVLTGPYAPEIATVHCYSHSSLLNRDDPLHPRKMIDWVRGRAPWKIIKVTEANIAAELPYISPENNGVRRRAELLVDFGQQLQAVGGPGAIDTLTFYGLPEVETDYPFYVIGEDVAREISNVRYERGEP